MFKKFEYCTGCSCFKGWQDTIAPWTSNGVAQRIPLCGFNPLPEGHDFAYTQDGQINCPALGAVYEKVQLETALATARSERDAANAHIARLAVERDAMMIELDAARNNAAAWYSDCKNAIAAKDSIEKDRDRRQKQAHGLADEVERLRNEYNMQSKEACDMHITLGFVAKEDGRDAAERVVKERDNLKAEIVRLKEEIERLQVAGCKLQVRGKDFPEIVCLCGSGRFREAFDKAEFELTKSGKIVLTIGCNTHDAAREPELAGLKPMLDELHKRKIDLCDSVFGLNVGGYIGESTRSEIEYAAKIGRPVKYLEQFPKITVKGLPKSSQIGPEGIEPGWDPKDTYEEKK